MGKSYFRLITKDVWLDWMGTRYVPEPNSGCWLWTGNVHGGGYGAIWHKGRIQQAHRVSYEMLRGPIGSLYIDHLCRTPSCVNPDHMEAVPPRINVLRGVGATAVNHRKTHCSKGHSLSDPANVMYERLKKPNKLYIIRRCRTCKNINQNAARTIRLLKIAESIASADSSVGLISG